MKTKFEVKIYKGNDGKPFITSLTANMEDFGFILICKTTVEADVPQLSSKEELKLKLDALESEAQRVNSDYEDKLLELSKRKAALLGGGENV